MSDVVANHLTEFRSFSKIARYSRDVIVSEKLDGTNACIYIGEDGEFLTGSRNRWITPEDDNHGFSRWAHDNKAELLNLGTGRHFGEWWGSGIQRGYGLKNGEKRFSLFNVSLWGDGNVRPSCCQTVPVLWSCQFDDLDVKLIMEDLWETGSWAAPGYKNPEGIVVYHTAAGQLFKKTFENDGGKHEAKQ